MTKRKWVLGLSLAAMVGAALWMRELASWIPRLVGNKIFNVREMRVSRDGRWLWTLDGELMEETFALDPPSPRPAALPNGGASLPSEGQAFHAAHGIDTFPNYWYDPEKQTTYFLRREGEKPVALRGVIVAYGGALGWSLARKEIYSVDAYVLSIWQMETGRFKRRIDYAHSHAQQQIFSPDGKWLLWIESDGVTDDLYRADVQSARSAPALGKFSDRALQFSPDGKYFLVAGSGDGESVTVFDAKTWKQLWSAKPALSARFSLDGRVGIVKNDGFEWREPQTGMLLKTLLNPAKGTGQWTTSPDRNWIYAENEKRQIVRWRAW